MKNVEPSRIVLLDGSSWDLPELLLNMASDDFYYGYLGQAALSSSSVKTINDSVKGFYYKQKYGQSEETNALIMGKMIHTLLLEGKQKFDSLFLPVEASTKTTNIFKAARENCPDGMTVVLASDVSDCERIVNAVVRNNDANRLMSKGISEVPAIGNLFGLPFRAKADKLLIDGDSRYCTDLKTTSDIAGFNYSAKKYGYTSQCYIYSELFNIPIENFSYVVVDKGSLDIAIVEVSREFWERGRDLTERACDSYRKWFMDPSADINQYTIKFTL